MAISKGNEALASDMNTVNTNVISTYKKYGFNGTTTTLVADTSPIDDAYLLSMIQQINACINDTKDRRKYYYTGSVLSTSISALQATQVSDLASVQAKLVNDYCSCYTDCCVSNCCVSDCCNWDGCGRDCCDWYSYYLCAEGGCKNCSCDSNATCSCNSDGCGFNCCNWAGDCWTSCGVCSYDCYDCCESHGCGYDGSCCNSDCCDWECSCEYVCVDCYDCCNWDGCGQD